MKNKPQMMITPKDRLYITDILNMANVYAKKCKEYEMNATDKEVVSMINEFHSTLCSHYDELLDLLKEESTR